MLALFICSILVQEPATPSERVAKIASEFAAVADHRREVMEAPGVDTAKAKAVQGQFQAARERYAMELVSLIRAHKDDIAALDGILTLVGPMQRTLDPDLIQLVLGRRDDPRAGRLCFDLRRSGDEAWAAKLVESIAEGNPSRQVRGCATFCRAEMLLHQAFPPQYGLQPRTVPPERKDALIAEARRFYEEVAADYSDVKTPDGKAAIGLKATHELARLNNLPNLKVGGVAPELVGEAVDGSKLRLSDYRGKVVAMVFWGSWCKPCMAMVPHEKEMVKKLEGSPFVLLGVNGGESREVARATMTRVGMTWPSFWDGESDTGPIATDYDVQRWPTVFVVDANGIIRFINVRNKKLEEAVESILAEMK